VLFGLLIAGDIDRAEFKDVAFVHVEVQIQRIASHHANGRLRTEKHVAPVHVEAGNVRAALVTVEVLFQLLPVERIPFLEAQRLGQRLVGKHRIALPFDVPDIVARAFVHGDFNDQLRILRVLGQIDRVVNDPGVVKAFFVVVVDEGLQVFLELFRVEAGLSPETPPAFLLGVLHFTPELAVGDLLVPFEKDLADFDFFAPVYVEMQDDLAVFVLLAARGDLREQVAFFFQVIPDDLLGTLNVGRAHPGSAKQRQPFAQLFLVALFQAGEGVVGQPGLFLHADGQVDCIPFPPLFHDLHLREQAQPVDAPDRFGQRRVARQRKLLADAQAAGLPHDVFGVFATDAFDLQSLQHNAADAIGRGRLRTRNAQRQQQPTAQQHHDPFHLRHDGVCEKCLSPV